MMYLVQDGAPHQVLSGATVVCMPEWNATGAQWTAAPAVTTTTTEQGQPQV